MAELETTLAGGVRTIRFNRPEVFNALSDSMVVDLCRLLDEAVSDPDVRVVVLTGSGAAFSTGADLGGADAHERFDVRALDAANRMVRAITGLDKPVVAAVNGVAAGVGASLVFASDLQVATASASFVLAFARVGLMPDGGASATVAAAIGRPRAMRLALLGESLPAEAAYDAGLVSHLATDEAFDEEVAALARRLASGAPLAQSATKRAVNAATLSGLDDALERERTGQTILLRTADVAEGMRAFGEKRRPRFTGE